MRRTENDCLGRLGPDAIRQAQESPHETGIAIRDLELNMKIVAFLQNMWVRDPERLKLAIERDGEELRIRMIEYALFAGCITGRRLKSAFGELCEEIVWEETTREIAGNPKTIFPAQPEHIKAVLEKYKPDVVLTFGKIAANSVRPLWGGQILCIPHPAARQPETIQRLADAARELKTMICPLTY